MNARKLSVLTAVLVTALLLAGCTLPFWDLQDTDSNTTNDPVSEPPEPAVEEDSGDFPGKEFCSEISPYFAPYYPWEITITPETFSSEASGLGGAGCRVEAAGTGDQITEWGTITSLTFQNIEAGGWVSDPAFIGGGAGGELLTMRKDGIVCRLISEVKPASADLCSGDEALAACLAELSPTEIIYQLSADCTPDGFTAEAPVEIPPLVTERVEFNPGAISVYLNGRLEHGHSYTYVLTVLGSQDMLIDLNTNPPLGGLITLFAESGQVFLSDHGDSMEWIGTVPATQDYFITVAAGPEDAIDYNLKVLIPPVGEALLRNYTALDYTECNTLSAQVSQIMGVPAYVTSSLFEDHVTNTVGGSCLISAWGNKVEIPDWIGTTDAVVAWIEALGWVEDHAYAAGGATGISTAYRQGSKMCIYTQSISPQSRSLCPTDQPISICLGALPPEQVIYLVELNCATTN
ncbi:MAG: hypothetical protein ABFS17_13215 [Chloroflexota bacterium]